MRVIVNAISAHTGGIVTYTSNLLRHLSRHGVDAVVYLPKDFPGPDNLPEGATIELRKTGVSGFRPVRRFLWEQSTWRRLVKQSGAEVLFSSANYGLLRPPIPQVLLVQGEISFNSLYRKQVLPRLGVAERFLFACRRKLVAWSARNSDLVVFPSRVSMDSVVDHDREISNRSVVNYLSFDRDLLDIEHARNWRGDGTLRILYLSVYYPHKDPLTLVRAVDGLNDAGVRTHAWITMEPPDFAKWSHGGADLDPLLEAQRGGTITLGRIPPAQVGPMLAAHDILVWPSLAETFGFPLVEAMAVGIPIVASDTPIHREICGDAALYFPPRDVAALHERVMELDSDRDRRRRLSERGRARARQSFSWDRHVEQLVSGFAGLAAR